MTTGAGLFLIAVGAILRFGISTVSTHGIAVHTIGDILMAVGVLGVLLWLVVCGHRGPAAAARLTGGRYRPMRRSLRPAGTPPAVATRTDTRGEGYRDMTSSGRMPFSLVPQAHGPGEPHVVRPIFQADGLIRHRRGPLDSRVNSWLRSTGQANRPPRAGADTASRPVTGPPSELPVLYPSGMTAWSHRRSWSMSLRLSRLLMKKLRDNPRLPADMVGRLVVETAACTEP